MTPAEVNETFTEKIERGIFHPVLRHLTRLQDAEDRYQDALCRIWQDYRSAALRGIPVDDAALVCGLRRKCFDVTHRFSSECGRGMRRDVMGAMAINLDGLEILRLDGGYDDDDADRPLSFIDDVSAERQSHLEDHLVSALDLDQWTAGLAAADKAIITGKFIGRTDLESARRLRCGLSTVNRKARRLGLELAQRAQIPVTVCVKPRKPRTLTARA